MKNPKTRLLTMEMMEEAILPRIEEMINERAERTEARIEEYRNEIIGFKDEVMGKVKNFEEEATVSSYQNRRTVKRVERIEKHLNMPPLE
jgi:hypothetical protein